MTFKVDNILELTGSLFYGIFNIPFILLIKIFARSYFFIKFINNDSSDYDLYETEDYIISKSYEFGGDLMWQFIGLVTLVYEYYNKTIKPKFHEITDNYFRHSAIILDNGNQVNSFKDWIELYNYSINNELQYDLILYIDYSKNDSKKTYTIISDNVNNCNPFKEMNVSGAKFIIFKLNYNNVNYDINLKEPYNFLVKDNLLTHSFFKYYMYKFNNIYLENDYNINYMTNDMQTTTLTHPFYLRFSDNGLTSFQLKKEENKNNYECDDCGFEGNDCFENTGLTSLEIETYFDLGELDRCDDCFEKWRNSEDSIEYKERIDEEEGEEEEETTCKKCDNKLDDIDNKCCNDGRSNVLSIILPEENEEDIEDKSGFIKKNNPGVLFKDHLE